MLEGEKLSIVGELLSDLIILGRKKYQVTNPNISMDIIMPTIVDFLMFSNIT
jgi:hypothetical protein